MKNSFDGYSLFDWTKGNWSTIKEVLKVGIPLAIAWSQTNNLALVGLITLTGKWLLDLGHYYFKDN